MIAGVYKMQVGGDKIEVGGNGVEMGRDREKGWGWDWMEVSENRLEVGGVRV